MKLEGKLKEGFFEWLKSTHTVTDYNEHGEIEAEWCWISGFFNDLPQSAQFGLIQEYADTLGYNVKATHSGAWSVWRHAILFNNGYADSRPEAQVAAIERLNEIVNQLKQK